MPEEGHKSSREREELSEQAPPVRIVYEPNPKHKRIPSPGRKGSLCPTDANGSSLLRSSDLVDNQRYATDGVNAYCAQRHDPGNDPSQELWHGYPIGWDEVAPIVGDKMGG